MGDEKANMTGPWAVGALKPTEVERLPPEALSQLAKDIVTNVVFTDRHVRSGSEDLLRMIFMPIAFGAFSDASEEYRRDIGMLYAYMADAAPRSINGYPMFFSMGHLGKADTQIVWEKVEKLDKALKEV